MAHVPLFVCRGRNVNTFFVVVIGTLFLLIGAGVLYQGVRVIFLVNGLLDKYQDWNERTSAAVVQVDTDGGESDEERPGGAHSQHASAGNTGASSHAAILALPLIGAPKPSVSSRAAAGGGGRSAVSGSSSRLPGETQQSGGAPQQSARKQSSNTAPIYSSYGLASDAARASTLYGAVGGAGSVTGDSISSRPPPALDGVLKRLRLRTYGLVIILPLCFLLRGFLNLVQPTAASGAIEQQSTILFPWFSTVIPDILGSIAVLALTAPYACSCRVEDSEQSSACWCLLGALQGGAMAVFDLLKEDCSACFRCMCCCCPTLFSSVADACSVGCRSCAVVCCGAEQVSLLASKDWDAVDSMVADGVPQRYFELHSGSQRILRQMDYDAGFGSGQVGQDISAPTAHSYSAAAPSSGGDVDWGNDSIECSKQRHESRLKGERGDLAPPSVGNPLSLETASPAVPVPVQSESSFGWHSHVAAHADIACVEWHEEAALSTVRSSNASTLSDYSSIEL